MTMPTDLPWTEFSPAALEIFHIWTDRQEEGLGWACSAWTALNKAGLTAYSNEVEKTIVLIRLMTLATMYHEFADLAWQEYFTHDYADWAEQIEITEIDIRELLSPGDSFDSDDDSLFRDRLQFLVNLSRQEIYKALVVHFDDDSGIFAALWRIQETEEDTYLI
jgi:hypothetical protein